MDIGDTVMISSESASHTESKYMCIMSVCSDLHSPFNSPTYSWGGTPHSLKTDRFYRKN